MRYSKTFSAIVLLLARAQLAAAQSAEAPPAPALVPPVEPVAVASPPPRVGNEPLDSGPQPVVGKWATTFYGFVEFDAIHDSTQPGLTSINDSQGNAALARPGSYQANNGQTLFGARNSRIGFKLNAPESDGIKASAVLEMDFLGNQPTSTASQAALLGNPAWADANVFCDLTSAVRLGAEYAYFHQTYGDGVAAKNTRLQFSGFYLF